MNKIRVLSAITVLLTSFGPNFAVNAGANSFSNFADSINTSNNQTGKPQSGKPQGPNCDSPGNSHGKPPSCKPEAPLYEIDFNVINYEEGSLDILGQNHVKATVGKKPINAWLKAEKGTFVRDYKINFEHTADSDAYGIVNIYMSNCNDRGNITASAISDGTYEVANISGSGFDSYTPDEFLTEFGTCEVRTDWFEFPLGFANFIYRSSDSLNFVEGDNVEFKLNVELDQIIELPPVIGEPKIDFKVFGDATGSLVIVDENHIEAKVGSKSRISASWPEAESNSLVEDYIITFEHENHTQPDVNGFVDIKMVCADVYKTASLHDTGGYEVDGRWPLLSQVEFMNEFGSCKIRNKYFEFPFGFSSFIYRSSSTHLVQEGDEIEMKFNVEYAPKDKLTFSINGYQGELEVLGKNHIKTEVLAKEPLIGKAKAMYAWFSVSEGTYISDYDITFEHKSSLNRDAGFVNIYMMCDDNKITASLLTNGKYQVNNTSLEPADFIEQFGTCTVRSDYQEFLESGIGRGSNFIYRSTGSTEVVAGEEIELKFDIKSTTLTF